MGFGDRKEKMNILISSGSYVFSDCFPGGEFQISYAIASRLAQRGNKVYVFTPLKKLKREIPDLTVLEIGRYDFIDTNYFHYFWNWWRFSIKSYIECRKLIKKVPIDVIHHLRPAFPYKFSLLWRLEKPFIYGPLSIPWQGKGNEKEEKWDKGGGFYFLLNKFIDRLNMHIGTRIWKAMLKNADCLLISIPDAIAMVPPESRNKVQTLTLGVDTSLFTPKLVKGSKENKILFVGNLMKQKGLHYLLKAIAIVKRSFPAVTLTVIGSGKDERFFKNLCIQLGLEKDVFFKGSIPFDQIVPFYQECDIFCLPSLGEAFGISILQAMSCGKPVVVTDSGGPPHFVEDGRSGYVVPPGDSESLANALIKLLSDKGRQKKMGEYNRRLCVEKYDWERIVDEIELIYHKILN